jgi:hypothetical protein
MVAEAMVRWGDRMSTALKRSPSRNTLTNGYNLSFRIDFAVLADVMAGFDSRRASREVTPGYLGGSQGLIFKLNSVLAVCGVGVDESCTVKVRL